MDQVRSMEGITIEPLKIINGSEGSVMHACKKSDNVFDKFGEAYFSTVNYGAIKGWKKHLRMISNIVVPSGAVKFVFFDDRVDSKTKDRFFQVTLSLENYCRLTIQPGVWMAFKGMSSQSNLILNVASIEHDPLECLVRPIESFSPSFTI